MPNNNGTITKIAWNFNKINETLTEIYIYDDIADKQRFDWWTGEKGTEVTPKQFVKELNSVTTPEICVRINSGGGSVFAAEAIRTQIRDKRASGKKITCKIDGICASAAVGIAAACETIAIPSSAYFMIHNPGFFTYGYFTSDELEKGKVMLDKIKKGIINAYIAKTGKSEQELSDLMTAETWYTGDEAVEEGFCDKLMFEDDDKNNSEKISENISLIDVSMYHNIPTALLNSRTSMAAVKHIQNKTKNKEGDEKSMEIKTVQDLKAAYPELVKEVENTATAAERTRIKDIEDVALPGFEEVINKAKFEAPVSAADVAMNIVAKQKKHGADYLEDLKDDVKNSGAGKVKSDGHEGIKDKEDPYGIAIDKVLPKNK